MKKGFVLLVTVASLLISAGASAEIRYSVNQIGPIGDSFLSPFGMNNIGQIVGQTQPDGQATIYANNTVSSIGGFGGRYSAAMGINNIGQVVGSAEKTSATRAFLYSNGSMTDLGTLGGHWSSANAINDNGQIVGMSGTADDSMHGFLYSNGTMHSLGTLGGQVSIAYDINNSGQIVGQAQKSNDSSGYGFLYSNGNMIDLGLPAGSSARSIANNGQIAFQNNSQAYLYDKGNISNLGNFGQGYGAYGYDNNSLGQVVGHAETEYGNHAFVYREGRISVVSQRSHAGFV